VTYLSQLANEATVNKVLTSATPVRYEESTPMLPSSGRRRRYRGRVGALQELACTTSMVLLLKASDSLPECSEVRATSLHLRLNFAVRWPNPPNLVGFDLFLFVLSCLGCSAAVGLKDGLGHRYQLHSCYPQQAGTTEARNPIQVPHVHLGEC
jgi:hypothetical protein